MSASVYKIQDAAESDAEGITFVHVNSWKTSYADVIDQSFLENISYDKRLAFRKEVLKSKETLHLVAIFKGQIVGFADAGRVRSESPDHNHMKRGEIYAIYLLEHHKRKGIGTILYKQCRAWFSHQGMETFVTWVLVNNQRARCFYEREGGKIIDEKTITIGEKTYQEVCYGFTTQKLS